MLTITAEAQARSGHDILAHPAWYAPTYARQLEPLDDVMKSARSSSTAKSADAVEFLGKSGRQMDRGARRRPAPGEAALRARSTSSSSTPASTSSRCTRRTRRAPTRQPTNWNWDTMVTAAEKLFKAGCPIGLRPRPDDRLDRLGRRAFPLLRRGARRREGQHHRQDGRGASRCSSIPRSSSRCMPPDVFAWDDASNNKYLISGQGAMIMNPPSA